MRDLPSLRRELSRGELVRLIYRLGRHRASGVLTLRPRGAASAAGAAAARPEVFVLRRGLALERAAPVAPEAQGGPMGGAAAPRAVGAAGSEPARRSVAARLARMAGVGEISLVFEGGVTAVMPPGAAHGVSLAAWARAHLEQQLDSAGAEALVRQLTGARLAVRPELLPEPADETDRRMLAALAQPRRLDQIWPLARAPRFRLLAVLHFLRAVDALEVMGGAPTAAGAGPAARAGLGLGLGAGSDLRRQAALRTLGVDAAADPDAVKRAYRRLARALHPDLQPEADAERRRALERRFAEITAAYESLA